MKTKKLQAAPLMKDQIQSAQIVLACKNLNQTLEFFTERLGFRLEMIFPADAPSTALISGFGIALRLEESKEFFQLPAALRLSGNFSPNIPREIYSPDGLKIILADAETSINIPAGTQEFIINAFEDENSWGEGRAGMHYRDLIPSRLGGRFIASHISIPEGGEIPDYVHYHKIRFQMIYCISGWAKLVYEDQGESFVMKAGDCVLQPPEIRHRVLKTSKGFEVLEIGCPAIHETFAEHDLKLPNSAFNPDRIFNGQKFVHHIAEKNVWKPSKIEGIERRDTGISAATDGLADVQTMRAVNDAGFPIKHSGEFLFFFIIKGELQLGNKDGVFQHLKTNGSFVLPTDNEYVIEAKKGLEMVRISLPVG